MGIIYLCNRWSCLDGLRRDKVEIGVHKRHIYINNKIKNDIYKKYTQLFEFSWTCMIMYAHWKFWNSILASYNREFTEDIYLYIFLIFLCVYSISQFLAFVSVRFVPVLLMARVSIIVRNVYNWMKLLCIDHDKSIEFSIKTKIFYFLSVCVRACECAFMYIRR